MSFIDIFAWIVLLILVATMVAVFVALGVMPGRIARKRGHPWAQAVTVDLEAESNWSVPASQRKEIVPGASHFAALGIASPSWRNAYQVATIGDHTFYKVQSLKPRNS